MNFFRNVTGVLLTAGVRIPIALASSIVLARYLSTDDRGLYAVATGFAALVTLLSMWGWPAAAIYRLRRIQSPPARIASAGLTALTTIAMLALALCWLFEPIISERFLDNAPSDVFYLAIAVVPLHMLGGFLRAFARGLDRFMLQNWAGILENVLLLAGYFAVLVLWDGGLVAVLVTILAIEMGLTAWMFIAVLRHSGLSFRFEWIEIRESFIYGSKSYMQGMAGKLHERVDVIMLAWFLEPSQVAFYAIATGLVSRLKLIPNAMAKAAFPQMSGLDEEDNLRFTCQVSRQSMAWAILGALALASVAPFLIPLLYGNEYLPSIEPFLILIPAMTFMTIYRVLSRYFSSIDRQQVNIVTQAVSALVNISLNLVLIPRYGITGAAIASAFSYALESILIAVVFVRTTDRSFGDVLVPRRSDLDAYWRRLRPLLRRLKLA